MNSVTKGRYRVVRIKRGQPHTVYFGPAQSAGDAWDLSATISTKSETLARELEQCRRERGVLDIGSTAEDLPNHEKLDRISVALRSWQLAHGRGGRPTRT